MSKLDVGSIRAMLQSAKADALSAMAASELSADREKALRYYLGEVPDMPAQSGRSSAVSTDVADTIEGLMPTMMDIFTSGDEVVKFNPVGKEDEQAAQQETDYVNHVFMQQNPGFVTLYAFIKDALLSKVGIVKVWWEEEDREEEETLYDLDDDQFAMLAQHMSQEGNGEIVSHTVKDRPGDPEDDDKPKRLPKPEDD